MGGWNFYSIERFYTAPLVYNVSCVGSALSFSTHNNFKQNNAYTGTYSVTATNGDDDDGTIASASFDFREHWRATYVEASLSDSHPSALTLAVENQWGDTTSYDVTC